MFSEDALVSMANGTFKSIKLLVRGDVILNKFGKKTVVLSVKTHQNENTIRVQLDNGTGTFYMSPDTIVLGYYRTPELTLKSEYVPISQIKNNNGFLKSDLKIFSPDSDSKIELYEIAQPQTLYSLITSDNSKSYKVNKVIVSNQPSHW
jgi:hypothetical protein